MKILKAICLLAFLAMLGTIVSVAFKTGHELCAVFLSLGFLDRINDTAKALTGDEN